MVDVKPAVLLRTLDKLEDDEARNLVWGLTEETWTEDNIIQKIATVTPSHDPYEVLEQLEQHGLVFGLDRRWPKEYRTRMAETMRLMSHLRQQFPNKPWQAAPRLVADFRFRHEARRFPERNIPADAVVTRLRSQHLLPRQIEAAQQILGDRELSVFQLDSTVEVFGAMTGRDRGVVVSAGTGSGKTLAFYLPALTYLATRSPASQGVGVMAIYPRNELLKDQLATALDETRRLRAAGGRLIRIGAYFGNTPIKAADEHGPHRTWRRSGADWICPFLTCRAPSVDGRCGGELLWRSADYQLEREQLNCAKCGDIVTGDEVVLTRNSMQRRPPDLLFTTTEMLNRSLSDGWSMHVFGVGPSALTKPTLVLLDEVHTYEGTDGAQVAYLLRRWRHLMAGPTTWVGLSATLANADRFFTDLCGLGDGMVVNVQPQLEHMPPRGREYQVVLRGDPGPQTALLSTTIQSLMLLRRVLDAGPTDLGAYGSRIFAFCDKLDLVNRLFRQVLDAEGFTPTGQRKPNGFALAGLRMSRAAQRFGPVVDWPSRDADGQQWWLAEQLGFEDRVLTIARTSSQDSGVSTAADIIVTTSSLEVGFDDPTVGAVLQHKAPRDIASFLQRRGRAGRIQVQRPWTVVVLSDYGRDRSAYQDYETLLAPALPEKRLPLGNQSVRKMQAAMCLIDWAANRLNISARRDKGRTMRKVFIQPDDDHAKVRTEVTDLLERVMSDGLERDELMAFVGASLRLSADGLDAVCWEQPRSLLLDVVPTARRRLRSNWAAYNDGQVIAKKEQWVRDSPLPEYIPKALFSDLCLPEVAIDPPTAYDDAARESIGVTVALNELAPGNVTMRWAVKRTKGLWIEPADDGTAIALEGGLAHSGQIIADIPCGDRVVPLVRPLITAPKVPDIDVQPSSNGRLQWRIERQAPDESITIIRPRTGPLSTCISEVLAYLHTGRGPLHTWRYATDTSASVVRRNGGRQRVANSFTWKGQPAALGYEATVDAQIVTLTLPITLTEFALSSSAKRLRQLRRDFFVDQLRARLHNLRIDPFLSRQIAEALVAAAALLIGDNPAIDLPAVAASEWRHLVTNLLSEGVIDLEDDDESDGQDTSPQPHQRLLDALTETYNACAIVETIGLLKMAPDNRWLPWLRTRYVQTVAAAWQAAAQQICPDFDADLNSVIDVDPVTDGPTATFVLSDSSVGGGGMLEALTSRISEDPRRFDYLVVAALQPSDLEDVDRSLREVLTLLGSQRDVADAAKRFRSATNDRLAVWQDLIAVLVAHGVSPAHATVTALASRIFRVGSSQISDDLLRGCLSRWDDIETRAGFAVDHRSICTTLAADPEIRGALARAVPEGSGAEEGWTRSVLQGLLWPTAEARRASSLVASNRFVNEAPMTERTLVLDTLPDPIGDVDVDDPQWLQLLTDRIARTGRCRLISTTNDRAHLKQALQRLATSPIELGWLHVHPHIEALSRRDGLLSIVVSLEEAPQ
ncbi:MAG TPA: protein DpdJ [Mycobacterium sp.]|jgi:superfamily II DNA or RNA helicase